MKEDMTEEPMSPQNPEHRKRDLHVWVRTIFVTLLVGGMAYGWMAMAFEKGRRQQDAVLGIQELGGTVFLDYEWIDGEYDQNRKPPQAAWLRKLLGDAIFDRAVAVDLRRVERLDEAVHWLRLMPYVQYVDANGTRLSDSSLGRFQRMHALEYLDFGATAVSDEGLNQLFRLPRLAYLSLAGTAISDNGLEVLARCPQLRHLDLTATETSSAAIERLRAALPKCEVVKGDARDDRTDFPSAEPDPLLE